MSITDYLRYEDFSDFQSDNPDTPFNGASFDIEFDRIKAAVDSIIAGIGKCQCRRVAVSACVPARDLQALTDALIAKGVTSQEDIEEARA